MIKGLENKQDVIALVLLVSFIFFCVAILGGVIAGSYIFNEVAKAERDQCREAYQDCAEKFEECMFKTCDNELQLNISSEDYIGK